MHSCFDNVKRSEPDFYLVCDPPCAFCMTNDLAEKLFTKNTRSKLYLMIARNANLKEKVESLLEMLQMLNSKRRAIEGRGICEQMLLTIASIYPYVYMHATQRLLIIARLLYWFFCMGAIVGCPSPSPTLTHTVQTLQLKLMPRMCFRSVSSATSTK